MKKMMSIITGTFSAFLLLNTAKSVSLDEPVSNATEEVSEAVTSDIPEVPAEGVMNGEIGGAQGINVSSNEVPQVTSAVTSSTPGNSKASPKVKKGSWWDAILKLFKVTEPKRTSEQAFSDMVQNQNVIIDFSNVTDFAQNGDAKMLEYYQKLVSTKAFGTKSPNIYVNLSNTGVTSEFIQKWATQFKNDKKTVIWNLSDNKNLDDSVVDALDFSSIYSLNLSGTSITDAGIARISATLETNGIGKLVCIHLSGSKVTDTGVASLKASMQKAVELWKTQNPGKDYKLQGADNSGVVFEKIPTLPNKGVKKQQGGANQSSGSATSVSIPSPVAETSIPTTDTQVAQGTASEAEAIVPSTPSSETDSMAEMEEALPTDNSLSDSTLTTEAPLVSETPAVTSKSVEEEANTALNDADAIISSTANPDTVPATLE